MFDSEEGSILAMESAAENQTQFTLLVPQLIGPPPLKASAFAANVSIVANWTHCIACPASTSVSTNGPSLWIYTPVKGVMVSPSKVCQLSAYFFYLEFTAE